jgi:hypothetical protein
MQICVSHYFISTAQYFFQFPKKWITEQVLWATKRRPRWWERSRSILRQEQPLNMSERTASGLKQRAVARCPKCHGGGVTQMTLYPRLQCGEGSLMTMPRNVISPPGMCCRVTKCSTPFQPIFVWQLLVAVKLHLAGVLMLHKHDGSIARGVRGFPQ